MELPKGMSNKNRKLCEEVFLYHDTDKDGKVSLKLLPTLMKCLGQNPNPLELKTYQKKYGVEVNIH